MQSESSKLSPEFIDVSVFVLRLYCNLILLLHICVRRTAFSAFCLLILFLLCCSIFLFLCSSFLSLLRALTSSVSSFFFYLFLFLYFCIVILFYLLLWQEVWGFFFMSSRFFSFSFLFFLVSFFCFIISITIFFYLLPDLSVLLIVVL